MELSPIHVRSNINFWKKIFSDGKKIQFFWRKNEYADKKGLYLGPIGT